VVFGFPFPPNVGDFLTKAGNGSHHEQNMSSGFLRNLFNNSSRSFIASALNATGPRPWMISFEEIFFCAVPPA
jgi:hypothetical protein